MGKIDDKFLSLFKERVNRLIRSTHMTTFMAALVAVFTSLAFIRVLGADFVRWDDDWCIYENPTLGPLNLENLRLIFNNTTVSGSWYTPLTGLRWNVTYQFCHLNPFGYHFGNWLFHIIDAVLLFFVLRKVLVLGLRTLKNFDIRLLDLCAAIGALIWSMHPIRVEAVAWSANAYGQALMFLLVSLLCYLRANEPDISQEKRKLLLAVSIVSFLASLLSQPVGLGFLLVLFILDIYPLRRIGGQKHSWKSPETRKALLEKLPFVGVALAVVLINIALQMYSPRGGHKPVSFAEFGLFARLMQAMYILAYYIWRPFYPFRLSPVYTNLIDFDPWSLPFLFSGFFVLVVTVILFFFRKQWPAILALWACYLVLLAPNLGLTDHPYYPNDRYAMIVSITFSVLAAGCLMIPKINRSVRVMFIVLAIAVVIFWGTLTVRQTKVWDNSIVFFKHIIHNLGDDPYRIKIHWRLGFAYAEQGNADKAIEQFHKTLQINPNHKIALNYLAQVLTQEGRIDEAVVCYKKILQIEPDNDDIMTRLAWFVAVYKNSRYYNPQEAIQLGQRACELTKNNNPVTLHTLAAAYAAAGRYSDAVASAEKALTLVQSLPAGQEQLNKDILNSLQMYKKRRPYTVILPNPK